MVKTLFADSYNKPATALPRAGCCLGSFQILSNWSRSQILKDAVVLPHYSSFFAPLLLLSSYSLNPPGILSSI